MTRVVNVSFSSVAQARVRYSAIPGNGTASTGRRWPPRGFHALAYNEATNTTLLYGGEVWPAGPAGPSATASDTWERANTWVQRADMGPPPLQMHSMVWNGRGVMLF